MRTNRVAVPVVVALCGLGLVGCSTAPSGGGGSDSKTLTMESFAGDKTLPALIDQFEKDNPGVTVKNTGLPYPQILTQINTQLVSGSAPDVVVVFPGEGNPLAVQTLAKNNYLADLTSQSWTSGLNDSQKAVAGTDGKIYLAANNSTIIPATYNSAALTAVGATAPKTWSDVMSLCSTAKANGKVAYALGGLDPSAAQFYVYALTASLVYGPDPEFASKQAKGDTSFSSSQWSTALTKLGDMQKAGCFSQDATGVSLDTAQGQVAKGDALGIVTVSNQIAIIQGKAAADAKFETAAFPATDDASDTYLPVGMGAGFGVNAKSKNADLAKKWTEFFMSKAGLESAIDNGSIFPSISVGGDFKHDAALDGVVDQAAGDKTTGFPDAGWPNSNVQQVMVTDLQKVIGGSTSVSDVLKAMDEAYKGD